MTPAPADSPPSAPAARIPATLAELAVPTASLRPYERNPRRGDVETIARSLEANGQYRPIVVRAGTNEVLAGNHTLVAAIALGWTEIAATFVDVDDQQAARIVLVDNRAADRGGYDDAELASLLRSLDGDLAGTGWADRELDRLLDDLERAGAGDADRDTEPAAPPENPRSKPGDLWRLGNHRLLCGSSTSPEDVARLFAGELAEMVWTDPPYGVDYHDRRGGKRVGFYGRGGVDGKVNTSFANDFTDPAKLYELVNGAFTLACEHTKPGGAIYVAHPATKSALFERAITDAGWEVHQYLVWVKNVLVLTRSDYHWQHESIQYGWKPGAGHRWNAGFAETTLIDDEVDLRTLEKRELVALIRQLQNERGSDVIRADRPMVAELHPTSKPVPLVTRMVGNSSRRGELVYEPFGGSGTTLIASENLERRCAIIEIKPAFVDVIVDRWERHTGQTAELEKPARSKR